MLASEKVHAVVVGADRVCANGDVINKIGTYALALLAAAHELPFMVAAPLSTVDPDTPEGGAVPIEERDPNELVRFHGEPLAPATAGVLNPVFDLTPARLLRWLVTERAAVEHPDRGRIELRVNGQVKQSGDLSDLIHGVPAVIAHLSGYYHLRPGDLIFTGTPEGVGAVKPGDRLEGSIEGVGTIAVEVGAAS